jgi:hypothetical protein
MIRKRNQQLFFFCFCICLFCFCVCIHYTTKFSDQTATTNEEKRRNLLTTPLTGQITAEKFFLASHYGNSV